MKYIAYRICNLINQKSYIGITTRALDKRLWDHCSRARNNPVWIISKAIQKYGWENFQTEHIASSWDISSLLDLEALLIKQENTRSPFGYNMNDGGRGSFNPTEE